MQMKSLVIILLGATWQMSTATECVFEKIDDIPADCTALHAKPLVIGKGDDMNLLSEKLKNIREIKAGLVVENTDIELFDALKLVSEIVNDNGPAAVFRKNSKLKRIVFDNLRKFSGKPHTLEFDDDNFPKEAHKSSESLTDLRLMEYVATNSVDKCDKGFLVIKASEPEPQSSGTNIVAWIFGGLALVFFIADALLAATLLSGSKIYKKLHNDDGRAADHKAARKRKDEKAKAEAKAAKEQEQKSKEGKGHETPKKK